MFHAKGRTRRAILLSTCLGVAAPIAAFATDTTISAGSTNAVTLTGTDTLTVTATGSQNVASGRAVTITGSTTGVSITNAGTINAASGRAIDTNGGATTTQSIAITNSGTITGTSDGIRIDTNVTSGSVTLTNSGTISATEGQAIDFDAINGATVTIVNTGTISSSGQDALRPGGNATITNSGTIYSSGPAGSNYDGIDLQAHAGSVVNQASGVISGLRHGITSDANVDVTNYGSITGRNGSGVGSDGDGTVVNHGTITGAYAGSGNGDGDGVDIDFVANITNYGIIQGTGAGGVDSGGSPNHSEGIAAGGGTIVNHTGALISGADTGILIDDGSGNGAYAATTITNAGTIQGLAGYGIRLIGDYADSITNAGTIIGAGGIAIDMGAGNDSLTLTTTSSITGRILGGTGTDTLTLTGTGSASFAGAEEFELLKVTGGIWTLTGAQSYADGTTIENGGTAYVNGSLASAVSVLSGGRLGGTGSVSSLDIAGTLAPGHDAIGTLSVTGDAIFRSGAVFEVRTDAAGGSSRLAVSGATTIEGGTVDVKAGTGSYGWQTPYTILTSTGGVSGSFAGVSSDMAFLTPSLGYAADSVTLTLTRNDIQFADVGANANQRAVGAAISAGGIGSSLYDLVVTQSEAGARGAFQQLAGEGHASVTATIHQQNLFATRLIVDRLRMANGLGGTMVAENAPVRVASLGNGPVGTSTLKPGIEAWAAVLGGGGRFDGTASAGAMRENHLTIVAGIDAPLALGWRAGVALGQTTGVSKISAAATRLETDAFHADLYAGGPLGALQLRTVLGLASYDIESRRSVSFTGTAPRADYDAFAMRGLVEAAYPMTMLGLSAEPFANLAASRIDVDGFRERDGGAASLSAKSRTETQAWSEIGLRLGTRLPLGGMMLAPTLGLGWQHAFGEVEQKAGLRFSETGAGFTARGVAIARDAATVQAGVSLDVTPGVELGLGYMGTLADDAQDHAARASLTLRF
ncbi:autotransporter domain-containing protein [Acetobacteraceae bacterium H6797]|nr:autotransporter domain-containing protein [Acetobacteraceae bacterium H6797]